MKIEWVTTHREESNKPVTRQVLCFGKDIEGVENQVINQIGRAHV